VEYISAVLLLIFAFLGWVVGMLMGVRYMDTKVEDAKHLMRRKDDPGHGSR